MARQMAGRLAGGAQANDLNVEAPQAYHELTACIECYACLDKCPMHARNTGDETTEQVGYRWGNPFSLLKLQRVRLDPITAPDHAERMVTQAIDFGLDSCIECPGCKCGVGIDLKGLVVDELLKAADFNCDVD